MITLAKNVKSSFLEIDQRFATIQGVFFPPWVNNSKNIMFCGILTFSIPILLYLSAVNLEIGYSTITVKNSSLASTGGMRMGLELFQSPNLRKLSLLNLSSGTLKFPQVWLILTQSLPSGNSHFFRMFVENNQWQLLNTTVA